MLNVLGQRIMSNVSGLSVSETITTRAKERTGYSARFAPVNTNSTIKDYNGKIDWSEAAVEDIVLTLENRKYFAFTMDSVEALLTSKEEIDKAARGEAKKIKKTEDAYVLNVAAKGAGATVKSEGSIYDAIVNANIELSTKDIPFEDRFAVISHKDLGNLNLDARFTHNYTVLENGIVEGSTINGVPLIVSNDLPADTAVVLHKEGIGFERFLDKIEATSIQDKFAEGIKGLNVFEAKVLSKKHIVKIDTAVSEVGK